VLELDRLLSPAELVLVDELGASGNAPETRGTSETPAAAQGADVDSGWERDGGPSSETTQAAARDGAS